MPSAVKFANARSIKAALTTTSLALSGWLTFSGWQILQGGTDDPPQREEAPPSRIRLEASEQMSSEDIARGVLARNIFDSRTGPIAWEEPKPERAAPENLGEQAPTALAPCPENLRLLAAVVFDGAPERSFGVLRTEHETRQLTVGMTIDNTTLVALAPTYAHVRDASGLTCVVPLFGPKAVTTTATPPPPKAPPEEPRSTGKKGKKPLFSAAELDAGITTLGGDRYRIRRELLTRAMADAAGVVRGSKFFPQTGGERNAGVKITGVPEGSVLHKLGVRSGDILRTLNGVDLSSTDGMLSAYALLKQQDTVTLAITRSGSVKNLQYSFD